MPSPQFFFRLPQSVADSLNAIADRINVSPDMVAKLIVIREVTNIPAMLEEHDRQLANMHQFLREMAFRNEDFLQENGDRRDKAAEDIMAKLDQVMRALDSIRDASFVRRSTFIEDLIREHDDRPVQQSLDV